jgi:hypothetical protein
MKWVTPKRIRVNRTATPWLIRRFIDPQAEFLFVEPEQVARVQEQLGAKGFDAPSATYPHKDARGRCSFEALVDEHCRLIAEARQPQADVFLSGDPVRPYLLVKRGAHSPACFGRITCIRAGSAIATVRRV